MWGQNELQTIRYAIKQNCSMGADEGHFNGLKRRGEVEDIVAYLLEAGR